MQWPKQRSWGWYATLIRTPWFCLKVLRFKPDGALSVQRHLNRTEIWWLIKGSGFISTGGNGHYGVMTTPFQKRIIPKGNWHRFIATEGMPVYAIELQYGRKVTESDIERQ